MRNEGTVAKERVRERSRKSQRREDRPRIEGRQDDASDPIREKRGDTLIGTLRQTYGDDFAPGVRGDTHLKTLLNRTGSSSLSDYLKAAGKSTGKETGAEDRVDQESPGIRYASARQFREAHRKTSALHAGLFRRLAE
jgi:hypothetical protein